MLMASALIKGGLSLLLAAIAALGWCATRPDPVPSSSIPGHPTAQVSLILDDVGRYLCADPRAPVCDRDPVNLLFVNIEEHRTPLETVASVATRLTSLDVDRVWQAPVAGLGSTMYFEVGDQRIAHHLQLKSYFGGPDGWHVRLVASPGCLPDSPGKCFVIGAAHLDTRWVPGCQTLPGSVDTSFFYREARELFEHTFTTGDKTRVAQVMFGNQRLQLQNQCAVVLDLNGHPNREHGVIAVIDLGKTEEVQWPPTDDSPLVLRDGMVIRENIFGWMYIIDGGHRHPISADELRFCGYHPNEIVEVFSRETWSTPLGDPWPSCR
jgi:hypothetical protein